jgi:hypothetical protein
MRKWEYLHIDFASSENGIVVGPAEKLEIEKWVQQYHPIKKFVNVHGDYYISFKNDGTWGEAYRALIQYVCNEGWEPFATGPSQFEMHFKRPIQDE